MKLTIKWSAIALLTATMLEATAPTKPVCCVPGANESAAMAELSTRSLYRLDATWRNDDDHDVMLASLRGHPVVMAMFFAQCEYACPMLVSDMQRLRAQLPPSVRDQTRIVLVTFDHVRDTPAELKAYRSRLALDAGWTLLHGGSAAVQELAMLLGVKYKQDARGQFSHSNLITVLNAAGEMTHQKAGLMGDMSEAAKAVVAATK